MTVHDALGTRMKRYETAARPALTPRTPVIARIDGRAFHTFTRGLARPYDADFHSCMWEAATAVCEDMSGCQIAYVQSDEMSFLLTDYATHNTQPWFDYELPKLCSTAAATATAAFLLAFTRRFPERWAEIQGGRRSPPTFDARFFNMPKEDVANYFLWRQKDAERNSLTAVAQAHYSHRELHGQGRTAKHDMLHAKGVNWNDLPTAQRRGVCIVRETYQKDGVDRSRWTADRDIPVFSTPEGRAYIERHVYPVGSPVALVRAIHGAVDQREWDSSTGEDIANLLNDAGFTVRDPS